MPISAFYFRGNLENCRLIAIGCSPTNRSRVTKDLPLLVSHIIFPMASGFHGPMSHDPIMKSLTADQAVRSVVVSNFALQTTAETIAIYLLEQGLGGEIDHVHIPKKGTAVVTFTSKEGLFHVFICPLVLLDYAGKISCLLYTRLSSKRYKP